MKVRKQKLLSVLLCAALTVTNIVSEGFQVSANELLPEQRIVVEDSTKTESEMSETKMAEDETGENLPLEETETETKEEETEVEIQQIESDMAESENMAETQKEDSEPKEIAENETEIVKETTLHQERIQEELTGVYQFGDAPSERDSISSFSIDAAVSLDTAEIEDYIYQQMKEHKETIDVQSYNMGLSEWRNIIKSVLNENPDLYFVNKSVGYSYGSDSSLILKISPAYNNSLDDNAFQKTVKDALAVVDEQMSDLEKAIALHDYLAVNCEYDKEKLENGTITDASYSAYGVLVNRMAVCQGYALAYKYLLNQVGIECYMVTSEEMNHAWNLIKLNGKYYQVDVTWDDPVWDLIGRVRHQYMFRSDNAFINECRHHDWYVTEGSKVVDYQAVDTSYDSAFWLECNSPLVMVGKDCYYIAYDDQSNQGGINKTTLSNVTESGITICDISEWTSWNGGGYWPGTYSGLFQVNNRLYYNDKITICSIALDDMENGIDRCIEFMADTTEGYIYGSAFCQGKVLYSLHQNPNLSAKETVLTADITLEGGKPSEIVVEKIGLDKEMLILTVGDTEKLQAVVTPDDATDAVVMWKSSDDSVATVENGTVTAVGAGNCTIFATAGGKEAECEVTVNALEENIASGSYEDITWVIDANGKLTVTGTWEFSGSSSIVGNRAPWYSNCKFITSAEVDVIGMTDASNMFYDCDNLVSADLREFKTENIVDMTRMFENCDSLKDLDLSSFDTTSVVHMSGMFRNCSSLTSLDLSSFDTRNVTDMRAMFDGCNNLTNLDLSSLDVGNVTDINGLFRDCSKLTTIYTPCNLTQSVSLPTEGTWYQPDGTVITELPKNLNYSIMITRNSIPTISKSYITAHKTKTVYNCGDTLNLDDLTVKLYGTDGTVKNITDYSTNKDKLNMMELGNKTLEVTYNGMETTVELTVIAGNDIASGSYKDIVWVIDANGKLTVDGKGDFAEPSTRYEFNRAPWFENRNFIKSAEVNVSGMTNASYMFNKCRNLTSVDMSGFDTGNVTDMSYMFSECSNLTNVDMKSFDTRSVTDMSYLFNECDQLTSINVSSFDTGNVIRMNSMFNGCMRLTNVDVSGFNTENVINMQCMFDSCYSLPSLNVSGFDTGAVTDMGFMFQACSNLMSVDVSNFDTKNVTNMGGMFNCCGCLTSIDVGGFDTRNVTNMSNMFGDCSSLASVDVSSFDTGNVTDMSHMFYCCRQLTSLDVSNFDTRNVIGMRGMFSECDSLTNIDISNFNTPNVAYLSYMFRGCEALVSVDMSNINTKNVTEMWDMFRGCSNLISVDVSGFDTGNVTNMRWMFMDCSSLMTIDLSGFDTQNTIDMQELFIRCSELATIYTPYNLTQSVPLPTEGNWYQPDGTVITELPQGLSYSIMISKNTIPVISAPYVTAQKTKTIYECGDTLNIDDLTVKFYNIDGTVKKVTDYSTNKDEIDLSVPGTKVLKITYSNLEVTTDIEVIEKQAVASGSYGNIDWKIDTDGKLTVTGTGDFSNAVGYKRAPWYQNRSLIISAEINVTGMLDASWMFSECDNLTSLNLSGFDTENVTNMSGMFWDCSNISNLDVCNFKTNNVTDMSSMFEGCYGLINLNLSNFDTGNVTDMGAMFARCNNLTNLNISSFDTRNVVNMSGMFMDDSSLINLDMSGFVTSKVTDMNAIFSECSSLVNLDVNSFDTSSVTDMCWMFSGCKSLTSLNVGRFDTNNVTDMRWMFADCSNLVSLDLSNFDTKNVINLYAMFDGCNNLASLDLAGFDTENITDLWNMFNDCRSLTNLDLSNFNFENVTDVSNMLEGCINLATIYTPYNLNQSVSLPVAGTEEVWYQPDGTAITELPQNLSYSIIITKKQQSVTGSLSVQKIKTAYNCGEELELNDLTVTYTAENGVDTEVTDYTTNAAEIDMSTPGIKTLAITYKGITVELELIVTYLLDEGTVEIILPDETYIYDGTAKQPEPIVTAGKTNTKLTSGKDYTISYESNIDAGTAFMIITGQNDYQGTLKSSFRINKAAAPETVEVNIYTPCNKVQEGQTFDIAGRYGEYGRITGYEIKDIVEDNEIGSTVFAGTPYIQDGILYYDTNIGKGGDSATVTVEVSFANYESALLNVVVEFTDERAVYTVRFELAGHGQAIAPVTVLETGSLIDEPMQPEAEGFWFMGWYKDRSCTEAWDFDTDTVQDNIILYAGWLVEAADSEGADLYIQEIQNQIYTGSALKPSIRVYAADGDTLLKEGKDYTIKYFNNKNADQSALALAGGTSQTGEEGDNGFTKKLAYVIIKGKGNYKGTIYRNFHIDAASIAGNDGEPAKGFTLKYKEQLLHNASKAQKLFQSLRYKKSMKVGTDYELKLSALEAYDSEGNRLERGNVIADTDSLIPFIPAGYKGTFLLTITGIGNYKGSIDKTVYVTDKNHLLKNATVSMGKNCKSVWYTGEDITLQPAYYDASQKKYYAVDNDGLVSTQAETDGNNVFVVKVGGKCLKYGEDYTVSYTNNQAVGTATMTISGKGEYLGSKDVTFRITGMAFNAKNISVDGFEASMEYTGKPLTQNGVRLKSIGSSTENSIDLTYGKDYTIYYKNNLKKGTATVTFTAKPSSGYTGHFKKTFKITAASLTDTVKVTAAFPLEDHITDGDKLNLEGTVAYEKAGAKPSDRIRLCNKDGVLLKEGIDYTVSYAYNKVVTTADTTNLPVMNLKGKGNYTGSLSVNFKITEASMEDNENLVATATEVAFYKNKADNYTYQPKITVMDGKHTLNPRIDYTVRYERCTQAEIKTYLDALQGGGATEEELEHLKPYAVIEAKEGNGYVGSIRKELTVYRTKLTRNNLYIVINTDTSQITYTGEQVKPEVTVYYGDSKAVKKAKNKNETREKVLTDKKGDYCLTKLSLKISENGIGDYTLSYGTNVTAGKNKGTVAIIGTGLYGGRINVKFTINSKDVYTVSK